MQLLQFGGDPLLGASGPRPRRFSARTSAFPSTVGYRHRHTFGGVSDERIQDPDTVDYRVVAQILGVEHVCASRNRRLHHERVPERHPASIGKLRGGGDHVHRDRHIELLQHLGAQKQGSGVDAPPEEGNCRRLLRHLRGAGQLEAPARVGGVGEGASGALEVSRESVHETE
jgi:hypothetical protein